MTPDPGEVTKALGELGDGDAYIAAEFPSLFLELRLLRDRADTTTELMRTILEAETSKLEDLRGLVQQWDGAQMLTNSYLRDQVMLLGEIARDLSGRVRALERGGLIRRLWRSIW